MAVALKLRGVGLKARGDLAGAVACYAKALGFAPECAALWSDLGHALLAQRQVQPAIGPMRRAPGRALDDAGFRNGWRRR